MNNSTRYLPTYEDATDVSSYSLRLPTYRSSYIRRYHPYARYTTPVVQEQFMDEIDYDEPFLDLSILYRHVEPRATENVNNSSSVPEHGEEQESYEPLEAPVPTTDTEVVDIDIGERQETNERPDQNAVFLRVGITPSS